MKKILFILFLILSVIGGCFAQVITIKHTAYEIHFDTTIHEPIYTHYILTKEHANNLAEAKRTVFHADSLLCKSCQAENKDYKGVSKKFDRGHYSPCDDFTWSKKTEIESMLMDNEAPQIFQFNRGTWKELENYVRTVAKEFDTDITTGGIYGTEKAGKLLIPTYYWKIIKYNGKVEAWKIPNEIPKPNDNFQNYKVDPNELLKLLTDVHTN